jgi:flagellar hook protein FlgE
MSFQQGLSGLNTSAKSLDVIGNNIANASTVGFKSATTQFADVYANSVYGSGGVQVGLGTKIADVAQQFTQGNITVTNNPLDVAINGSGFFQLYGSDGTTYSRNGQFHLDADGYLVNSTGQNVVGYTALSTDPVTGAVIGQSGQGNIKIDLGTLPANQTTSVKLGVNLDATSTVPATTPFNPTDPNSYNYSTTVTVYDSQGTSHALTYYFVKTGPNAWDVNAQMDGGTTTLNGGSSWINVGSLAFDTSGIYTSFTAATNITADLTGSTLSITTGAGGSTANLDFSSSTQVSAASGVNSVSQDGYSPGQIVGVSIDSHGVIYGRYSNNQTKALQQLIITTFQNPNGLISLGNNQWAASLEAGSPSVNPPGQGLAGVVQAGSTEDSNVDLTTELVNLIVAQRQYQANAQTIKAQDTILQTLVNLG